MKKLLLLTLFFLHPLSLFASSSWSVPQEINTRVPYSTNTNVATCYLENTGELLAIWPHYPGRGFLDSFYSEGHWSSPRGTVATSNNASCAYFPARNEAVIAWRDYSSNLPTIKICVDRAFSPPLPIPGAQPAASDIIVTYYQGQEEIIVTWKDAASELPYFAIYDGEWSTPAPITTTFSALSNVHTTYNSAQKTIMATWCGVNPNVPIFALYNGTWSEPVEISNYQFPAGEVTCCYNESDTTTVCAWVDIITHCPMYTIITANGWSKPALIPAGNEVAITTPITLAYAPSSQEVVALWINLFTRTIFYTAYSRGSWNVPITIGGGATAAAPLYTSYYPPSQQLVLTWADNQSNDPLFSLYTNLAPLPPTNLVGIQKVNNFGVTSERYNALSWQKSPSENTAGYIIYRNGVQIAAVDNQTTSYEDHNRSTAKDTYSITAVSPHDGMSIAVTITVGDP